VRFLLFILAALSFTSTICISIANAAIPDDSYIAGYAAGVLKHSLKIDIPSLTVRNGIIAIPAGDLPPADRLRVVQVLSEIPGVTAVQVVESAVQRPAITPPSPPATDVAITGEGTPATGAAVLSTGALPEGHLFKPLLADPRWAHFSAAYRNYVGNNIDGNNNGAVSFGETIPFYRANLAQPFLRSTVQWEAGLQAAVFSDFNLGGPSSDLINSDFIASAYSSMRVGHFSAFARIFHQSSHLGDEFLLRTRLQRINLSYEGADLRLSYEFPYGIRVYGGGGGIFHREPSTLKPWTTQYGIEFRSPWRLKFASMRPIVAVDVKNHEQNNWNSDVSARAGIQFDKFQAFGRRLQFLMEYFSGNSPTGQFYRERVEYLGIGAHYHY
jgi:hypothetical protein